MRLPFLGLFILLLPLLEIAGFVVVGRQIGVLATIGLVLLSGFVGALLLRIQGIGVLARIQDEVKQGHDPSRQLIHGLMIMLAGILLMIPGFVSDIVGLLLFIPPVRDVVWHVLRSRITVVGSFASNAARRGRGGPTIDLDSEDYSRAPRDDSPWRRIDQG